MRSPTADGALVPTGKASTATETTSNEPLLRFYATEKMKTKEDSKMENSWTSIPSASYDSSNFWRLLAAGGSLRLNPGKIGPLIQAIHEVTSAPARFGDRDARWFVVRLYVLEQPGDDLQRFFGRDSLVL